MALPDALKGKIDVPVIGQVPKVAVVGVVGIAVVYVGYRWWQASQAPAEPVTVEPGYGSGAETLPSVSGGAIDSGQGGLPLPGGGGEEPNPDSYGFTGTHNDQWSQYVTVQLTQSNQWSYTEIVTAIGQYLARKPLKQAQVDIVQAAIGLAGYPPEGTYTVILQGADTPHIVAPGGLHVVWEKETSVGVRWDDVAGADGYRVYANGQFKETSGHDNASAVTGLHEGTAYTIEVSAVNAAGTEGPKASVSAHTSSAPAPEHHEPAPPKSSGGHRTWRISNKYPTLSQLVAGYNRRYGTHFSWRQIWEYNLDHRSARTVRILKKRGPDKVYHGSAFYFPK